MLCLFGLRYSDIMGGKESKQTCISYEDAIKRVSDTELRRVKDAFKKSAGIGRMFLSRNAFQSDVLCEGVPSKVVDLLYTACGGTSKGITFKDLLCGLVLLTRGTEDEKLRFLWNLYCNETGNCIQKQDYIRTVGLNSLESVTLFNHGERVNFEQFHEWILKHKNSSILSSWLLSGPCINLTSELETPTFYQSLAGVTHLEEKDIGDLEKEFWSLKNSSPNTQLDLQLLGPLISPPIPKTALVGLFNAFDENRDGHIDFKELCCGVSAACRGPEVERTRFCFKIFDIDRDGVLNHNEIVQMINVLTFVAKESRNAHLYKSVEKKEALNNLLSFAARKKHSPVNEEEKNSLDSNEQKISLTVEDFMMWSVESNLNLVQPFLDLTFEVCHIVFGLWPQCKHLEHDIVCGWLEREKKRHYRVGQFWYLISHEWMLSWLRYTQNSIGYCEYCKKLSMQRIPNGHAPASTIDEALACDESFNSNSLETVSESTTTADNCSVGSTSSGISAGRHSGARPGPIDNLNLVKSNLYKNVRTLTGEGGHLRRDTTLAENHDFQLVPKSLWKALNRWYGDNLPLPRQVIKAPNSSEMELELYPLNLRVVLHQSASNVPTFTNWGSVSETIKNVSAMNYYSYRLMLRTNEYNHILHCRRLFHQYVVDMYAKIETERLNFIRYNQRKLRSEEYIHLRDAVNNDSNVNDIGRMIILPATYTGSPRHMHEYAQDAMSYVRHYGRPDLFITFTCNPQWTEIMEHLFDGQSSRDRHDITARVFKQKLKSLMDLIFKLQVFGEVRCWMYSVEWQKRGLPHAHILIWLVRKITPDEVDSVISAEIPDQIVDPELHEVVIKNMIHGPCGELNINSPCMIDGKCTKRYPRALVSDTVTGNDGYPLYRRRSTENNGRSAIIKIINQDVEVDNRWIVPYSPLLSKTFKAHINVEYCNSVKSIKYICKYVNKGSDMAVFGVTDVNRNDEITQYQMGRYISSNEAIWRIFSFQIHERHPTVVHLAVHLENGQRVYFSTENALQRATAPPGTTLTAFFTLCQVDAFAKTLLYAEIPTYYTWNAQNKEFKRRKQGTPVDGHPNLFFTDALGRIYTVHPNNAECFYLRLLLINVRGPTSFQHLRTINGHLCATYREACQRLNLLENDTHWDDTIADASTSAHPNQIRTLFSIIISSCFPANPLALWTKYRDFMAEDILHRVRRINANPDMELTTEIYTEALIMIEDICLMIVNKSLTQLGLPSPDRPMHEVFHRDLRSERQFDCNELRTFVQTNMSKLNVQQKGAYDSIMQAVNNGSGGMYFLDAPGGTGKTFLISLLLAAIRSQNKIALALASSGIAATLLDGGRTAHSALKLPLNMQINETPTCNISKTSGMAKVLQQCNLIVWDECTMAHKKSLEALDRTLKDLRGNQELFGGALIMLAGDFRQTLPVIPRSTAADEIQACLKSSCLWRYVKTLPLNINVRVQLQNDPSAAEFSKQLLKIGNGELPIDDIGLITLPSNFCHFTQSLEELIESVFPNIAEQYENHVWLSERAIMAAKNKDVNELNTVIQFKIPGDLVTYKSVDTVTNQDDVVNYPTEFLNSLDLPGLPPHNLQLKVGVPIIMLRNINQPKLCNGTRLAVKRLMNNLIEATILKGKFKGENVLIPRIPMIPSDLPFEFKRLQFPVRLAFAITINKAQGQSMEICEINLEYPVFSHGQLCVACSRVGGYGIVASGGGYASISATNVPHPPKRFLAYTAAFSRLATVHQICEFLCHQLRLRIEDVRLWHIPLGSLDNNAILLEEECMTLKDLMIKDNDQVLLEIRNKDLTWPEELGSLSLNQSGGISVGEQHYSRSSITSVHAPGATGLHNLGNTCFMNAALQVLFNTQPLAQYFRLNMHLFELNTTNKLGTRGQLALRYGELLKEMWSSTSRSVAPLKLRFCVTKHAPQFAGGGQHDSQELLEWFLDALHEDLNRVTEKPYSELKDSNGRPDKVVATEAWTQHHARNQSIVIDLFYGQLKSKVNCLGCGRESVRFDPFSLLSLPLPVENFIYFEILVVLLDGSVPIKYGLRLNPESKYCDLKEKLAVLCLLKPTFMLICEMHNSQIRLILSDKQKIKPATAKELYVYQLPEECSDRSRSSSMNIEKGLRDIQRSAALITGNDSSNTSITIPPEKQNQIQILNWHIPERLNNAESEESDSSRQSMSNKHSSTIQDNEGEVEVEVEDEDVYSTKQSLDVSRSPENTFTDGYPKQISSTKLLSAEKHVLSSLFENQNGNQQNHHHHHHHDHHRMEENLSGQIPFTTFSVCNNTECYDIECLCKENANGKNNCSQRQDDPSKEMNCFNDIEDDDGNVLANCTNEEHDIDADEKDSVSNENYICGNHFRTSSNTTENSGFFGHMTSQQYKAGRYLIAVHRKITRQDTYFLSHHKTKPSLFGVPILLPNTENGTHKDLYCSVWLQVNRLLSPLPAFTDQSNHAADCDDSLGYDFPFTLCAVKNDGLTCAICPWSNFCRGCEIPCNDEYLFKGLHSFTISALSSAQNVSKYYDIEEKSLSLSNTQSNDSSDSIDDFTIAIDWDPTALHLRYQSTLERLCKEHESVAICRKEQIEPVDLNHCLRAFTSEEKLEEWYHCAHCKGKKPATKKLQIWKLPPILIVHLKRFNCVNEKWVKSQKVVHFPFDDFDPTPYLASVPQETILRHRELREFCDTFETEEENFNENENENANGNANKLADIGEYIGDNGSLQSSHSQFSDKQCENELTNNGNDDILSVQMNNFVNTKNYAQLDDCCNIVAVHGNNHSNSKLMKNKEAGDHTVESTATITIPPQNDMYNSRTRKPIQVKKLRKRLISTSLTRTPIIDGKFEDFHQHKLCQGEDEFDPKYKLYAVVCHSGMLSGGHYVSYAANKNGTWYCFNDSSCREIPSQPNIDPSSAYLLFYERKGLDYEPYLPCIDGKFLPNGGLDPDTDDGSNDLKKLCSIS